MNDLLVTNEQVALRRENANVFLLKFAHTRVSLLSSIDINMTTTTTTRRKQKRSSSSSLHSSSSSSSAPSSSSSPSRRAMMTLLLLLFGTISDVFVVRATWPIVRYKNGTVGVKNDGGTVKVQSTDLIVDGNLSVSGSLFLQDRDLAEYEDRVSFLETALGDPALLNLSNCSSVTYRSPTAYPKEATEWDYLSIPSVVSGTTQFSLSWTDIKSICTHKGYILCSSETFCTNYVPPSALDIPEHDSWIAVGDSENEWLTFRRGWNNRICKTHTEVAGSKPSWGTSNFTGTTGDMYRAGLCCSVGDTSESMCTSNDNNTTTSVVSQLQSLTPPKCMRPGGTGLFFNGTSWICECVQNSTHVLHGESCENTCIQNATQIWNTTTSSCQEIVTQVTDLTLTKPSSLTHWFDFSDTDEYGSTELAVMTNFTDKMGGASSMTVNYNVQYKLNVQNGLNAIYANEQYASLQFSSKSGSNPEVFVAYRIVNNVGRPFPATLFYFWRQGRVRVRVAMVREHRAFVRRDYCGRCGGVCLGEPCCSIRWMALGGHILRRFGWIF